MTLRKLTAVAVDATIYGEDVDKVVIDHKREFHHPKGGSILMVWEEREDPTDPNSRIFARERPIAVSRARAVQAFANLAAMRETV